MSEILTSLDFRHLLTVWFPKSSGFTHMFYQKVYGIQKFLFRYLTLLCDVWIPDTFVCISRNLGFQTFRFLTFTVHNFFLFFPFSFQLAIFVMYCSLIMRLNLGLLIRWWWYTIQPKIEKKFPVHFSLVKFVSTCPV